MIQNILRLLHITTVLTRYNILPYLLPPSKKSINKIQGHKLKLPQTSNASMYRLTPFSW